LWLRAADTQIPPSLSTLALYDFFDGADLFGSTFKLCSIVEPRASDQVILVDTLAGFAEDLRRSGAKLPPHATPFMIGSGQWVYFTVPTSDQIHEYDLEQAEPSGAYKTIAAIVDEWAQAMIGGA
jgi:hypothetical protein